MSFTEAELKAQLSYAIMRGWLPLFKASSARWALPLELLLAIASRETNMRNILGDGGHGHGIMQIDDRPPGGFPTWCRSGKWENPAEAINMGALVLRAKYDAAKDHVPRVDLTRVAVAMYNAGPHALTAYLSGSSPDLATTGRDYSADVLARARSFAVLLAKLQ